MTAKLTTGARLLTGFLFVVFGLNGFLHFIPMPQPPEAAGQFLGALAATGYFFPVLKLTEIAAGLFLLFNIFTPLGIILLSPVVVQIFLYHAVLDPGGLALPIVLVLLQSFLGYSYFEKFKPLFTK